MIRRSLFFGFFSLFMGVFFMQCGSENSKEPDDRYYKGVIHISCDESFKPVIDAQVEIYEADYPDAKIIVHYKPEADCLRDFAVDSIRMVVATRGYSEAEKNYMIDSLKTIPETARVAFDAIAVIVNPASSDSFFSMNEIKDLLTGKLKENLIPVFDGLKATSTVRFMLDSVLKGDSLGKNVVAAQSSEGVIDYVSKTKNAVGFLGISWVGNRDDTSQLSFLKKVKLAYLESTDNPGGYIRPVQANIYLHRYPLIRDLVYVLKEKHIGLGQGFANFLRSERGQLIFRRAYLMPSIRPFYIRHAELREK